MRGGQYLHNQIQTLKGQVASLQARADASDQKLEILLAYISPASRPGEGPQVENISILTPEEVATIVTQLGSGSTDYRKHQEKTINLHTGKIVTIDAVGRVCCYASHQDRQLAIQQRSRSQSSQANQPPQAPQQTDDDAAAVVTVATTAAAAPCSGETIINYQPGPSWESQRTQANQPPQAPQPTAAIMTVATAVATTAPHGVETIHHWQGQSWGVPSTQGPWSSWNSSWN